MGAALLDKLLERGWLRGTRRHRALELTDLGVRRLHDAGLDVQPP